MDRLEETKRILSEYKKEVEEGMCDVWPLETIEWLMEIAEETLVGAEPEHYATLYKAFVECDESELSPDALRVRAILLKDRAELSKAKREIEVLRYYGARDNTAMADEFMKEGKVRLPRG